VEPTRPSKITVQTSPTGKNEQLTGNLKPTWGMCGQSFNHVNGVGGVWVCVCVRPVITTTTYVRTPTVHETTHPTTQRSTRGRGNKGIHRGINVTNNEQSHNKGSQIHHRPGNRTTNQPPETNPKNVNAVVQTLPRTTSPPLQITVGSGKNQTRPNQRNEPQNNRTGTGNQRQTITSDVGLQPRNNEPRVCRCVRVA
jgi:hypothetical protein